MKKKDKENFKKLLTNWLEELLDQAGDTVSGMTVPKENFPDPTDRAALEADRNFMLRIRDREHKLIKKIKQAIVGSGAATKAQIQHMVEVLLSLQGRPQQDAADALAIALCHVHTSGQLLRMGAPKAEFRRGRLVDKSS